MSTDVFRRATTLAGLVLALMLGPAPAALAQKVGFNCVTDGGTNCTNAIPDATGQTPGALTSTITVPSGACPTVGRVCVSLGVEHSWRGDLSVDLTHGATTSTLLAASPGDDGDDVFRSFVLGAPHAGGSGDGAWTLTLRDNANGEYGALNNWKLGLCCGDGCGAGLVSATPASGLVTTELGGTAQFRVELSCPPDVQVTLPVASSDASEGVAGVTSLVFTKRNPRPSPSPAKTTTWSMAISRTPSTWVRPPSAPPSGLRSSPQISTTRPRSIWVAAPSMSASSISTTSK